MWRKVDSDEERTSFLDETSAWTSGVMAQSWELSESPGEDGVSIPWLGEIWSSKIIDIIVCVERLTIHGQIAYGFCCWKEHNFWKWCKIRGVGNFRHTGNWWIILSDRRVVGSSTNNMFFGKNASWIIKRNLIFLGLICRDISMHRFSLISGFMFNKSFVRIGGIMISFRVISVSRVGKGFSRLDGAFKWWMRTSGVWWGWSWMRIGFRCTRVLTRSVRRLWSPVHRRKIISLRVVIVIIGVAGRVVIAVCW